MIRHLRYRLLRAPVSSGSNLTLSLIFAGATVLDSRVTFTRASSASYFDSAGLLQTASSGVARFDHRPDTLAARGLMREEARTNVVLWNRDCTNAVWTKTNCTAALDQTGLGGAANTASSLTATAGNATCLQAITLVSAARWQTAYVKRITGTGTVEMTMDNGTTWTVITVTGSWTRVTIPTQTLANPTVGFRLVTSGDAIAVDCVQNENSGAYATSAILTTTVAATRVAEAITVTGANFTPWYSQAAGSFRFDFEAITPDTGAGTGTVHLYNLVSFGTVAAPTSNSHGHNRGDTATRVLRAAYVTRRAAGTVIQLAEGADNTLPINVIVKTVCGYTANPASTSICVDGAAAITGSSGVDTLPVDCDTVYFMPSVMNGWIRQFDFYNTRLSDATLQTLSA